MEFLPVLELLDKPKEGIWYSLLPGGRGPGESVGHTCVYIPAHDGGRGRILIVGGANPSGSFSDCHVLNLDNHEWDVSEWEGLAARYEHCCFVPESSPQSLWVFGGAQQTGNRNCIQNVQLTDSEPRWKQISAGGDLPRARTYHTSSACVGDRLYVFSGGEAGAEPVADAKLHVFDAASSTWSQPDTHGQHPPARHGHIIAAVGSKIFIHGGMAGENLHDDMYSLDTGSMKWEKVQTEGDVPPGRAAHSAVALEENLYVFGGMTAEGATNSMYRFNTENKQWTLMAFEGDLPAKRLDHSMCIFPWQPRSQEDVNVEAESRAASETVNLLFVFGGMDTQGVIHNDCIVTALT